MELKNAVAIAHAVVSSLGLKESHQTAEDVSQVIDLLKAEAELYRHEAELYRRGYQLIGACDIGNYLARCEEGGKVMEE